MTSPYSEVPMWLRKPKRPKVKTSKVVPAPVSSNKRVNNDRKKLAETTKVNQALQREILQLKTVLIPLQQRIVALEGRVDTQSSIIENLAEEVLIPKMASQQAQKKWRNSVSKLKAMRAMRHSTE